MQNTGREFKAVRRSFFVSAIVFNLFLGETGHRKETRALGHRVIVTKCHEPAVEVNVHRIVHVSIGDLTLDGSAAQRIVGTEAHAVAVYKTVTFTVSRRAITCYPTSHHLE